MHVGSYAGLPGVWGEFMAAVTEAGHTLRDAPNLEAYLNTPGEVPEGQLQTRLYIAIE
jgi:effector-binding domain-containing protein